MFDVRCILYYYYIIYYIILLYIYILYILYYSLLFYPPIFLLSPTHLPSSSLLYNPLISSSFKVYVSGLPSPYLYSSSFPDNSTPHVLSDGNVEWCSFNGIGSGSGCVLTPHVLSEWMVEVCRFEYLGIVLVFSSRGMF